MPIDAQRPIEAGTSLWTEELTWMEVRDAVKAGTTTIIIGTGGVEQNGPYVAGGKHNYVLQTVLPYIARAIPNSLIAPIVKFVPEGQIEPATSGHMKYPGTISLEPATFEALLTDICRSYKAHGFKDIVLLGDSGGNQAGMKNVAEALNRKWDKEATRVHFLGEYYTEDRWSYDFLKTLGITQIDTTKPAGQQDERTDVRNNIHDDIYYEAQVAVQDPALVRADQRQKAGLLTLHGVNEAPVSNLVSIGRQLAEYRAQVTARAFRNSVIRLRGATAGAAAAGQTPTTPPPDPRSVRLRGDRFKPLSYDEMTPAQKTMIEHLLAGPRGGTEGPFNVLLRSPEMGDLGQQFGASTRFGSSVPRKLYEMAIIITARHWSSQFEWVAHHRGALQAGLSASICDAIAEGRRPTAMQPDEAAVYNFASELLTTRQVSDATFKAAKDTLGERGVVDLIGVMGWYGTVSMLLNVDRYPLPEGTQPELKPLK